MKPEFFTSDDIVDLSPLARLLFIGLWCEADREGRFQWKPNALKRRYLANDKCDVTKLLGELLAGGMIRRYGDDLAYIPSFAKHQHINPRESQSILPAPTAYFAPPDDASVTRDPPVSDATVTCREEGKGKESISASSTRPFKPPSLEEVAQWCNERKNGIDPEEFIAHYTANGWMRGGNPIKDWKACVVTWEKTRVKAKPKGPRLPTQEEMDAWNPAGGDA